MTILEEDPKDSFRPLVDQPADMDLSKDPDLIQTVDKLSGLKLVKFVIQNCKHLCKLFSKGSEETVAFSKTLADRINQTCEKHSKSADKAAKFFSKISPLSCEDELFRTALKYGMNSAENTTAGPSLIGILQAIYSVGAVTSQITNPTLGIQMIVSHSSAPDIFLESHQHLPKHLNPKQPIVPSTDPAPPEKYSDIKTQLLKLWKHLVIAFTKISKSEGTSDDKQILENSVPYLLQMYTATRSPSDLEIFQIVQEYTSKRLQIHIENMPLFGPKSLEPALQKSNPKQANPLFIHSSRANTILGLIMERQAFKTAMEYREPNEDCNKDHYDVRFLLPLICHVLDAKNICDAIKVVHNGWIYLIVRGMSLEDPVMRKMAFLAYKLLIQNFQLPKRGFKVQDIKVWLHFLLSVRHGVERLGACQISNLLATWVVSTWEAIRQPGHPMYQRLTTLLFAKPTVDLTVIPDFMPFYNAVDGNKQTREWIMNVLSHGLHTREDWQIAQKLPTINSLCCSFLVEKLSVQREIIMILVGGARIPQVATEMVERHGLLLWIANTTVDDHKPFGKELQELFRTLRENCEDTETRRMLFEWVERRKGWGNGEEMEVDE